MKHDNPTFRGPVFTETLVHGFASAVKTLGLAANKTREVASNCLVQLQIGKMQSVLNSMDDLQLKQIDLKRCDINQRAKELVTYEYDGL